MPSCNAVSRNQEWLAVATKLSLQERDCYEVEAKIEVFYCLWFNGNVRTLPRIRSCSDMVSPEAVAKTAACWLLQFVAFWERYERLYKLCQ